MEFAVLFKSYVIPVCLFSVMMGLGLSLSVRELLQIFQSPKAMLVGLTGQIILLPLLAFGTASVLNVAPIISIGMILLAACPGGITSNGYVFASRGDTALSVALTLVSSILCIVSIPVFLTLALKLYGASNITLTLPVESIMLGLAKLTLLPVIIGMLLHHFQPGFAKKMIEPLRIITLLILIFVILGSSWLAIDTIKKHFFSIGLVAVGLNVLAMGMGYGLSRLTTLNAAQTVAITYEVGIQNLALALLLANTLLQKPEYGIFAIVYAFMMKFSALSFMAYSKKLLQKAHD